MRLLQLTPKPPYPPKDGGAVGNAYFLEMWNLAGWSAFCLTMSTFKHPYDPTYPTPVPLEAVPVNTRPTPWGALQNLFSAEPYHVARFRSSAYQHALSKVLHTYQPDLIQVESPYLTPYITAVSIPAVYRMHNLEWQIWERHAAETSPLLRPYFRLQAERIRAYEAKSLFAYAGLLPISEKEADWAYQAGYRGPMETFPFGLEIEKYTAPPLGENPPRLGFLGGLDWLPNQQAVVWLLEKVWPAFRRRFPEAELSIAGRNCPRWLYRYADSHTHILGEVPNALEFFHRHEIFLSPLFSGSGIRIKLIEAFATGRAIVATSIAAESLTFQDGVHLHIADTPEAFLEAMSLLYADPVHRQQMGAAARQLAETHYDRKVLLPRLKAFYLRVLAS
ncbi:MAG: glycosyltransferase [Bacteroidetes bacterium]|nr:MAG: glycosyltransferase [Bacteroidota bacterium]